MSRLIELIRFGSRVRGFAMIPGKKNVETLGSELAPASSPSTLLADTAARCHEIQVCLGDVEVPEFEAVLEIGMAVRLALHLRGLAAIPYEVVRLVAAHYLGIPAMAVQRIVLLLAEVEFVAIQKEGNTIKAVLPNVPYYESLYGTLGEFAATERTFNEGEQLSLEVLRRLATAPEHVDTLRKETGAERKLFDRAIQLGEEGAFLVKRKARGRSILLSPTYFSQNADTFADLVAAKGATQVQQALAAVRSLQGVPLSMLEKGLITINDKELPGEQVRILKRLAEDGIVKPPSIKTSHAGDQYFLFTPTPTGAAMSPTKREIYERAMALVAAVRQGQFLAKQYRIKSPGGVLYTLLRDGKLGRSTTEANEQYRNLVRHRIAQLIPTGGGFAELRLIDTKENREALRIALALVDEGSATGIEVDEAARQALTLDQPSIESIVASGKLRKRELVELDRDQQLEIDALISGAMIK